MFLVECRHAFVFSPSHCVTQCHVCIRWPNKVGSLPKLEPAANEGEDGRLRQIQVERGGGEPFAHFLFQLVDLQQHNTVTESCGWTCTEDMHRWPQKQGTRHAVHSMLSPCRVSLRARLVGMFPEPPQSTRLPTVSQLRFDKSAE